MGDFSDWETSVQTMTHKLQQVFLVIQSHGGVATVKKNWEGVLSVGLSYFVKGEANVHLEGH